MNYTEKYHLPQWVKADRIMMDDFNAAMANIESGLDGKESHLTGLDKGLFRMAYNHYCTLKGMDPQPEQVGVFYHDPFKDHLPGAMQLDGARYMAVAEGNIDRETFFQSFQTISEMQIVPGDLAACTPQVLTFSSPLPGRITRIALQMIYTNTPDVRSYWLKVKNMNTGVVEWVKYLKYTRTTGTSDSLQFSIPFHANVPYQMILEPAEAAGTGYARIAPEGTCTAYFYSGWPGCSTTYTMHDFEGSQGGMAIVRCKLGGTGGTVSFTWNGQTMEPTVIRSVTDDGCEPIQEWIYLRNEPLPKINEFSLSFQCNMNGDILFYDWGAILF